MTYSTVWSSLIAGTAKHTLRPFADALPQTRVSVHVSRAVVALGMFIGSPPPYRVVMESINSGTVRGEWLYPASAKGSRRIILYVHGSGYAICSSRTHRGIASRLARSTGMPTFVVDYRLAPEHRFPAAADDVEAAYAWLLDIGYRPENITVIGDSAGGHLILDLIAENGQHGRPQPRALVLLSPLVDLTLRTARRTECACGPDPLISSRAARRLVGHYTRGRPEDLPRLALTLRPGTGVPPALIHVGGAEMLRGDAELAATMIRDAGAAASVKVWPEQVHVFQALPRLYPAARQALEEIAEFVRSTPAPAESFSDDHSGIGARL